MLAAALIAALLGPPDVGAVADVAEARAAELGRNPLHGDQAGRIARAAVAASERHQVPVPIIFAIIESESAYGVREMSSMKCVGLMQVNPSTARQVAKRLGMKHYSLTGIEDGIELGTAYLREMWDRYGRLDWALSAYNRGPGLFEKQGHPVGRYAKGVMRRLPLLGSLLTPTLSPDRF
jgi:soluble lytic murein transglycosylase-like protein